MRSGQFKSSSGIKRSQKSYKNGAAGYHIDVKKHSRRREIGASEDPESCDVIVADCVASEKPIVAGMNVIIK